MKSDLTFLHVSNCTSCDMAEKSSRSNKKLIDLDAIGGYDMVAQCHRITKKYNVKEPWKYYCSYQASVSVEVRTHKKLVCKCGSPKLKRPRKCTYNRSF